MHASIRRSLSPIEEGRRKLYNRSWLLGIDSAFRHRVDPRRGTSRGLRAYETTATDLIHVPVDQDVRPRPGPEARTANATRIRLDCSA